MDTATPVANQLPSTLGETFEGAPLSLP